MKPFVSRLVCAAAALRDLSVDELAFRTGLPVTRISQLRSGARVSRNDARLVLDSIGATDDALIKRVLKNEPEHSPGLNDLLLHLLVPADPEPRGTGRIEGTIACDKLALVLPQAVVHRCDAHIERALTRGRIVHGRHQHKQAVLYRDVFIGLGLHWHPWNGTGLRLEFNPSTLTKRSWRFVGALARACSAKEPARITRIDIAVDLSAPIGWLQPIGTRARKLTCIGTARALETFYVGDKKANTSIAVYDKTRASASMDPVTRVEARLKKRALVPSELQEVPDPFRDLRLLWLAGEGASFEDRVLLQLARVFGWPLLARELDRAHFDRLVERCHASGSRIGLLHPSTVFRRGWRKEARRVLRMLGAE